MKREPILSGWARRFSGLETKKGVVRIQQLKDTALIFLQLYYIILLARIIFSWFSGGLGNNSVMRGIYKFLYAATEPLMAPLRKIIPPVRLGDGYLDLSPLLLFVLIWFLQNLILRYM